MLTQVRCRHAIDMIPEIPFPFGFGSDEGKRSKSSIGMLRILGFGLLRITAEKGGHQGVTPAFFTEF